jgi:hypothetical protein
MDPINIPKTAISVAFKGDPEDRYIRIEKATNIREEYSGGPNRKASLASGGAAILRPTMLNVPAMKDPKAAIPRAGPALP